MSGLRQRNLPCLPTTRLGKDAAKSEPASPAGDEAAPHAQPQRVSWTPALQQGWHSPSPHTTTSRNSLWHFSATERRLESEEASPQLRDFAQGCVKNRFQQQEQNPNTDFSPVPNLLMLILRELACTRTGPVTKRPASTQTICFSGAQCKPPPLSAQGSPWENWWFCLAPSGRIPYLGAQRPKQRAELKGRWEIRLPGLPDMNCSSQAQHQTWPVALGHVCSETHVFFGLLKYKYVRESQTKYKRS